MKISGTKDLTYNQRLQLSEYLQRNTHKKLIARYLNCCLATIYNEIKRGTINGCYDPNFAHQQYCKKQVVRGRPPELLIDTSLAKKISDLILIENLSPEKAIKNLQEHHIACPSKTTIYAAIDKGLIPNVTRKDLHSKTTSMFSNGLIRVPSWIRNKLNIHDGDTFTILLQDNKIIFEKNI